MVAKGRKKCALGQPIGDVEGLRVWVRENLGLVVPVEAVCAGHQAPMEYLRRAYFEDGGDVVVGCMREGQRGLSG